MRPIPLLHVRGDHHEAGRQIGVSWAELRGATALYLAATNHAMTLWIRGLRVLSHNQFDDEKNITYQ